MSQLSDQLRKSSGLLDAVDAITHRRAFITLFCTFAAGAVLVALVSAAAGSLLYNGHDGIAKVVAFLGFLVVTAAMLLGVSATGFLLNDHVRGREGKTIGQALMLAVATVHRLVAIALIIVAIGLVVLIAAFLVIFVCKIPGVGPLLFAVVFPVCAVILGTLFYAGLFIVGLHGPAVWEGNTVFNTVTVLGAIFRDRVFSVAIQNILLGLLVGVVAGIVFGCVAVGLSMTSSIAIPVLGESVMGSMASLAQSMMGGGGGGAAYMKAGIFGMTVLGGMAITVPALVAIAGNCIIFANATENLSTADINQKLQGAMDAAREKAAQARKQLDEARAQAAASAANTSSQPRVEPVAPASPQAQRTCPHCKAPCADDDVFCGVCGKRMS